MHCKYINCLSFIHIYLFNLKNDRKDKSLSFLLKNREKRYGATTSGRRDTGAIQTGMSKFLNIAVKVS